MVETPGLAATCTTLGSTKEDQFGNRFYAKGDFCLDNLKDLLRFLRRDDPQTREVFKQICKWKIVSKDLLPIIRFYHDDRNLVLNAVKVLVFLTMPIEASSSDVIEQTEYLWGLKSAIASSDVIALVVSLLEDPLENLQREMLTEDDWKLVQLVMTLFRNVIAIQDFSLMQKVGESATQLLSLRDRFLELLFRENVMDIVIVMAENVGGSHCYFRQDNLLLLEIFHYIFKGQDPGLIAEAGLGKSKAGQDIKASLDGLKSIMEEEEEKRRLFRQRNISRHSQFSGTFTRLTMDGSKAVCKRHPSSNSRNVLLRRHEAPRGPRKKIVWENGRIPSVKGNVLGLLHDFLNQLLSGGYNVLMQSVRDDIEKEIREIQNSDVVVYFQVAQFVTSFQRKKFLLSKPNVEKDASNEVGDTSSDRTFFNGDMCGPIAASMNESTFVLVLSRWRYAFDGLKETHDYRFLSAAGSLMKTMIQMLDLVLELLPEDFKEPQTARILLYKLFYDQTDQGMTQFLLNLIKSFDTHKQPRSDLSDLVEMVHIMIRLIENLQARGTLRVSKKARRQRKKKEASNKQEAGTDKCDDDLCAEHQNVDHIGKATDLEVSQHQSSEGVDSEHQEKTNLSDVVDETEKSVPEAENKVSSSPTTKNKENNNISDMSSSSEDLSDDERPPATQEVDFKVSTLASAFASHGMIKNLCWLLAFYKSNSISTNHCIVSVLRRITDDLDLSPMLYQLSLLPTYYKILEEQKSSPGKDYTEIVDFLTTLVRRMLRKMKSRPFLFVEVLFWKSRRECCYMNAEHLSDELKEIRKQTSKWGSASASGEAGSSHNREWAPRNLADALGDDEADVVIPYDLGDHREENTMEDQIDKVPIKKRRLVLTEELGSRIKELYEQYKDDDNCCHQIAECLGPDFEVSPAQIFNKLKQLGLSLASKKRMRRKDRTRTVTIDTLDGKGNTTGEDVDQESIKAEVSMDQSRSNKKRRRSLGKDHEEMIKTLFEKYKDDENCCHQIAECLGPDFEVSPAQIFNKLKQLGLSLASKKRMRKKDRTRTVTIDTPDGKGNTTGEDVDQDSIKAEVSMDQSRFDRSNKKRRRSLGKDQEEMIKTLFEKFQGNKRCNQMIANALAPDNSFTAAAQVARKLKQLGLKVSQRKISETDVDMRDDEHADVDTEADSDDETLLSLSNRKQRKKQNIHSELSGDSDNELLCSILKKRKKQNIHQELSGDSDNELLGSTLKKSRKVLSKGHSLKGTTDKLETTCTQTGPIDEDPLHDDPRDNTQRNASGQSVAMQHEDLRLNEDALTPEAEVAMPTNKDQGLSSLSNTNTMLNKDDYAELEDSEDDTTSHGLVYVPTRRKLKMVDYEDDDDD